MPSIGPTLAMHCYLGTLSSQLVMDAKKILHQTGFDRLRRQVSELLCVFAVFVTKLKNKRREGGIFLPLRVDQFVKRQLFKLLMKLLLPIFDLVIFFWWGCGHVVQNVCNDFECCPLSLFQQDMIDPNYDFVLVLKNYELLTTFRRKSISLWEAIV